MSANCCHDCQTPDSQLGNPSYRRVLWIVLGINAAMFAIEIGAGLAAGSASLQADALRSRFSAVSAFTMGAISFGSDRPRYRNAGHRLGREGFGPHLAVKPPSPVHAGTIRFQV